MPQKRFLKLHNERVLWPEQKGLADVLELQKTTIPHIFATTYQGFPTSPSGNIFKREWWEGQNRYSEKANPVARWISFDTSLDDTVSSAKSAAVVAEMTSDYRLRIIYSWAEHVQFPQLVDIATQLAHRFNDDKNLSGVVIEKKASGYSLIQTLRQSADDDLARIVYGYTPKYAKETRWNEAAVWCSLGCVLLPKPSSSCPWLYDFEQDLFECPDIPYVDRMDAFAQLILYAENYLAEGYRER